MRTRVRRLLESDRSLVMALIDRDPVMGSLVHSFIARRGLEGEQEFWGVEDEGGLAGLVTYDPAGRSTVLGCGPHHAPLLAEFGREHLASTAGLAFMDAEVAVAAEVAALLPPASTESLGVWVHAQDDGGLPAEPRTPAALRIRNADPEQDRIALSELYAADPTFRALGVQVDQVLDELRRGLRLMLVGEAARADGKAVVVSAAFAWLTDARVARVAGVVTHPDYRGRGFARAVVGDLTRQVRASGRVPYLYVSLANAPAVRVYARLGYRQKTEIVKLRYGARLY